MNDTRPKALILDMDGVIWRSGQPIGDLPKIFGELREKNIPYCFATNNSSRTVDEYVQELTGRGIPVSAKQIFTSGRATAQLLREEFPTGKHVYMIGMPGLVATLAAYGFQNSTQDPMAVVVGIDFDLTYETLKTASLLIRTGVPFFGTNPDKTFPTPEGQTPGTGAILAAISAATGVKPRLVGKPQPVMFQQALEYLGEPAGEVLAVGDRLETDIAGGQAAGCQTAVVLSGVTSRQEAEKWRPALEYIVSDLHELISRL